MTNRKEIHMNIYELIEKVLSDLNVTASNILTTAQNIIVLRDAMKAADAAKIEEAKKALEAQQKGE